MTPSSSTPFFLFGQHEYGLNGLKPRNHMSMKQFEENAISLSLEPCAIGSLSYTKQSLYVFFLKKKQVKVNMLSHTLVTVQCTSIRINPISFFM